MGQAHKRVYCYCHRVRGPNMKTAAITENPRKHKTQVLGKKGVKRLHCSLVLIMRGVDGGSQHTVWGNRPFPLLTTTWTKLGFSDAFLNTLGRAPFEIATTADNWWVFRNRSPLNINKYTERYRTKLLSSISTYKPAKSDWWLLYWW